MEFTPKTRIDFRYLKKNEKEEYRDMLEYSGWEMIYSSSFNHQHYFRQKREDASSEIFSEKKSFSDRYLRMGIYNLAIGAIIVALNILPVIFPYGGNFSSVTSVLRYISLVLAAIIIISGIFYLAKGRNIKQRYNSVTETGHLKTKLSSPVIHGFRLSIVFVMVAFVTGFLVAWFS